MELQRCLMLGIFFGLHQEKGNWHKFWGENGDVLIGEVSTVNDDLTDNVFAEPIGRFSEIEEDVDAIHLLVSDYEKWNLL